MATVSAPTTEKLAAMLGPEAFSRFEALCAYLQQTYSPQLAWHDGGKEWTYECKFRRGGKTIASLLADEGKAGLLLIFGKAEREKVEALRASLSPALLSFYDQAATYRDGKWALFPLDGTAMLEEVLPFLTAKRKPGGKKPAIAGEKLDFKKAYPDLYLPKQTPSLVTVPPMPFLMVDGTGDPAGECYQEAVQTLYALAFSIKMRKRTGNVPQGYVDYVVPPLEGLWWSEGGQLDLSDRSSWHWTAMLRQPDFVTKAVFEEAVARCGAKSRRSRWKRFAWKCSKRGFASRPCIWGPIPRKRRPWTPLCVRGETGTGRTWANAGTMSSTCPIRAGPIPTGSRPCCASRSKGRTAKARLSV